MGLRKTVILILCINVMTSYLVGCGRKGVEEQEAERDNTALYKDSFESPELVSHVENTPELSATDLSGVATEPPSETPETTPPAVPVITPKIQEESSSGVPEVRSTPARSSSGISKEQSAPTSACIVGKVICIDAGHGITGKSGQEKIAPDSSEKKPAHVSGTRGAAMTEEQVALAVALKLEKKLSDAGAQVIMTRTTEKCDQSNIDRANFANDANADLCVRIHADGSSDSSAKGMSMLIPSGKYIKDKNMLATSKRAGETVLAAVLETTGAKNRGVVERSDMTGFNWSKVPVILIEMGFMTNQEEDSLLSSSAYQDKIVEGMLNGLEKMFS